MILDVELLTDNNCVFGAFQETSKVQCMYLAFKNLKIINKKAQQWSES